MMRHFTLGLLVCGVLLAGLAGSGCSRERKAKRYAARAEKFRADQEFLRAEIDYITAIQLGSTNSQTMAGLGFAFYEQGKLPQAFGALTRAVEADPRNAAAHAKLGVVTRSLGQVPQARKQALAALDIEPGNNDALLLLADTTVNDVDSKETLKRLEAAPADVKDGIIGALVRGTLKQKQRDPAGAEAEYQQALQKNPKSEKPYVALASIALASDNVASAEGFLRKAAELAPLRSPAQMHLAELLVNSGKAEEAKQLVTRITEKASDYLPAWNFLARRALAENDHAKCEEYVKRVLELDPSNYEGLNTKGDLLMAQAKPAEAIKQFEFVIQTYGTNANHFYKLATALTANRQANQAIAALDRAVAASSNHVEAILLESALLMDQGNNARAAAMLRSIISRAEMLPRQSQARLPQAFALLARAQAYQRNTAEAAATYEAMRKVFPTLLEVHLEAAIGLADLKRTDEAKAAFMQYVNATTNAVGLIVAGTGLVNIKDLAAARTAYEKAYRLAPDYVPALEALVRLDSIEEKYQDAIARAKTKIDEGKGGGIPYYLIGHTHVMSAVASARKSVGTNAPDAELMKVPEVQGEIKEAEAALKKAVEVQPLLTAAHQELAMLYVATGRQEQAANDLRDLLSKTNAASACLQLALIESQQGKYKEAAAAYEKLIQIQPNSIEGLNNLAGIYSDHLQQPDRAVELARKARQIAPRVPAVSDTLGWALYRQGDYSQALGWIRDAAAALPQEPEVSYHLGMAYYMLGQEQAALANLQKATSSDKAFHGKDDAAVCMKILTVDPASASPQAKAMLDDRVRTVPNDVLALTKLAAILEKEGAFEKAAQTYQSVLKFSPGNGQAAVNLARLYSDVLKDPDQAFEVARTARNNNVDNPELARIVGRVQWQKGNWAAAVTSFEESARSAPDNPEVAFDLAWAYYSVGRVNNALELMKTAAAANNFSKADQAKTFIALVSAADQPGADVNEAVVASLKADSEFVPALYLQALRGETSRDYGAAAQLYERVLKRFPEFTPAVRQLALLSFQHLKQDQRAFELAQKIRATQPNDAQITRMLGILTFRRGEYARATPLLNEASQALRDDAEVFFHLGMAQKALKRKIESRQSLERAIELKLPEAQLKQAKQALEELKQT